MEEMFKKGQGFIDPTTGDVIQANDPRKIEYIFDEVTEPFEWPADVPTMEESMKWLNEQLQKNGCFYPTDPFRVLKPTTEKKVYLVNVHSDNGERYPEDYIDYDFVLKAFGSKESVNAYFSRHEEVARDTANYLKDNDACHTDDWKIDDISFKVEDFKNDVLTLYVDTPSCELCVFTYSIKEMEVLD